MQLSEFFHQIKRTGIYSNNLWCFVRKLNKKYSTYNIEIHYIDETLYIGVRLNDDFIGNKLITACCTGSKTATGYIPHIKVNTSNDLYIDLYIKFGRNLFVALGYDWWIDNFTGDNNLQTVKNILRV